MLAVLCYRLGYLYFSCCLIIVFCLYAYNGIEKCLINSFSLHSFVTFTECTLCLDPLGLEKR